MTTADVEVFEQMVRTMNILSYRTVHSEVHSVHTYTVHGAIDDCPGFLIFFQSRRQSRSQNSSVGWPSPLDFEKVDHFDFEKQTQKSKSKSSL